MKNLHSSVSAEAIRVASNYLLPSDRVLVIGATGWFGQTATALAQILKVPSRLIASTSRDFKIGEQIFSAYQWDEKQIREFSPTIVIDAAYITRDFVSTLNLNAYVETNRELTNRLLSISDIESVRKIITFSSGAAVVHDSTSFINPLKEDPYGFLKLETEKIIQKEFAQSQIDYSIVRAWSVSGALVTKVGGFAFSDLIKQASFGSMKVTASKRVFRRYCLVEEAIAVALTHSSRDDGILDTGGPLVELHQLAEIIKITISNDIVIEESPLLQEADDTYYSDGESWENVCEKSGLVTATLPEQIKHVFNWIKD